MGRTVVNSMSPECPLHSVNFIASMILARSRKLVEEICLYLGAAAYAALWKVNVRSVAFGSVCLFVYKNNIHSQGYFYRVVPCKSQIYSGTL